MRKKRSFSTKEYSILFRRFLFSYQFFAINIGPGLRPLIRGWE
jgi:hypothetical protein